MQQNKGSGQCNNNVGKEVYRGVALATVTREDLSGNLKDKEQPDLGRSGRRTIQYEEITG